jgi:ferritin-like metal-binding protein YciE
MRLRTLPSLAAQRVEHYEIAAYSTVREFAKLLLSEDEAESLLSETLEEEKETDRKLTTLATQINPQALHESSESEEEESESDSPRKHNAKTAGM